MRRGNSQKEKQSWQSELSTSANLRNALCGYLSQKKTRCLRKELLALHTNSIAARTEGIMKEVIDGMLAGAVCVLGSCTRLRHHAGFVYGAASSNDRRTRAIGLKTERLPRRSC